MENYRMPILDGSTDVSGNLACFLTVNTGSCFGKWNGRISAKDQRAIFGRVLLGKRKVYIDGSNETVVVARKVAFGGDWDYETFNWINLT